jgi:hypothetical protein
VKIPFERKVMNKKNSLVILNFVFLCCLSFQAGALENYSFENKSDTSYANVKRGSIRLKIPNDYVPDESQLKDIAIDSWEKYGSQWETGSVFIYVKDMPTNDVAYAVVEFNNTKMQKITVMSYALEMNEIAKKTRP